MQVRLILKIAFIILLKTEQNSWKYLFKVKYKKRYVFLTHIHHYPFVFSQHISSHTEHCTFYAKHSYRCTRKNWTLFLFHFFVLQENESENVGRHSITTSLYIHMHTHITNHKYIMVLCVYIHYLRHVVLFDCIIISLLAGTYIYAIQLRGWETHTCIIYVVSFELKQFRLISPNDGSKPI